MGQWHARLTDRVLTLPHKCKGLGLAKAVALSTDHQSNNSYVFSPQNA